MVVQAIGLESNERKLTVSPGCDLGQAPILCEALVLSMEGRQSLPSERV